MRQHPWQIMTEFLSKLPTICDAYDSLPGFLCAACEGMYCAAQWPNLMSVLTLSCLFWWNQSFTFSVAWKHSRIHWSMCEPMTHYKFTQSLSMLCSYPQWYEKCNVVKTHSQKDSHNNVSRELYFWMTPPSLLGRPSSSECLSVRTPVCLAHLQ